MSVRVFAPAKINLTLQVGRPRADGRHPLQSVVAFADVGDWIEAAPAEALSLTLAGPFAEALRGEDDNLVLRAARALALGRGAALTLTKELPVASGIGGGSSDAAAALKALRTLWRPSASDADLVAIATTLGADVPVCLDARPAYMTGAGERVTPLSLPALAVVLVNPLTPLSTAAVYREFDRMGLGGDFVERPAPDWSDAASAIAGIAALGNDLAAPARALAPAIGEIEATLRAHPLTRHVGLSGSGATVFAIADTTEASHEIALAVRKRHGEWWVRTAALA